MKKYLGRVLIALVSFSLSFPVYSSPSNSSLQTDDFIVAKVNSKAITNLELMDRYQFVVAVSKLKNLNPQDKKILQSQILDKMIDEELARQEAASLKIEAAPDEVREMIDIVAAQQKKNATQFKLFFVQNKLSFNNYLMQVESEILWSKIVSEVLRSKVKITDVEVKEFFEQHDFDTDMEKFHLSEVLISNSKNAEPLAVKLVDELRHGADFRNIVRQFSSSITVEHDGEIGWVSKGDIDQKIYAEISKLEKGQYSNPVSLLDGYRIFKLLDRKVETKIADQDLTAAHNAIFSKKLQILAKGYAMDLRKKAFVEVVLK